MANDKLWEGWLDADEPQTILIPDEIDNEKRFNYFYGMPTRYWAGIWGRLSGHESLRAGYQGQRYCGTRS